VNRFYSKRNQVYPTVWENTAAVEKHFLTEEDWAKECDVYLALHGKLPIPKVLARQPRLLVLKDCCCPTLLEELERQECVGFSPEPWSALAVWLKKCLQICRRLPTEGNLRNFLWNADTKQIIGLDFETYHPSRLSECGATIAGTLLTYSPMDTMVKQQAVTLLMAEMQFTASDLSSARQKLLQERQVHSREEVSGIILAGGLSRRMGSDKSRLKLGSKTLLELQVEKMRALGIRDILLSGSNLKEIPETKIVPDIYSLRGPLGGLHACLKEAANPAALVLGVDIPLVPINVLSQLIHNHSGGATVLGHKDKEEPLIGVYDSLLHTSIESLIINRSAPVRKLRESSPWTVFQYYGPEEFLQNCNTAEDFLKIRKIFRGISNDTRFW